MKPMGWITVVVLLGGGGFLGYSTYARTERGERYVVKPVDRGDIVQTVAATGTIEPITKVIVGSQVSGNIMKWHADFNAQVTEGFVLAELDPDRFETTVAQASAELDLAKARAEELEVRYLDAERELKRLQGLHEQAIASDNEMLIAQATAKATKAAWHGAQASVKSAEASLSAAKVDLERTIIRSPIDGIVISRNIDVGQTVAASLQAPELFLIANNLTRMQVNANVSESDIGLIREGGPATFHVDAYPKRTFEGTISQVRYNPTIVEGVVTYVTLIEVHNDDMALRPGMTASVTFEVARARNAMRVPSASLRFSPEAADPAALLSRPTGPKSPAVYTLEAGQPKRVEVRTGLTDGGFTEVASGERREGQSVIVDWNWAARGGDRVDITRSLRPPGR